MPYTVSYDIPAIQRLADSLEDDTINDPLYILINAEDELEFDDACSFPQCYIPCKHCKLDK